MGKSMKNPLKIHHFHEDLPQAQRSLQVRSPPDSRRRRPPLWALAKAAWLNTHPTQWRTDMIRLQLVVIQKWWFNGDLMGN